MTIQTDIDEEQQRFKDLIFTVKRKGKKTLDHLFVCDNRVFGWKMCFFSPTKSEERQQKKHKFKTYQGPVWLPYNINTDIH